MKKRLITGMLTAALVLSMTAQAGAAALDLSAEPMVSVEFISQPEAAAEGEEIQVAGEDEPSQEDLGEESTFWQSQEEPVIQEVIPEEGMELDAWEGQAFESQMEDVPSEEAAPQPEEKPEGPLSVDAVFSSGVDSAPETGAAVPNTWQWDPAKGAFAYYDGQGKAVPIPQLAAQETAAGRFPGYFEIHGRCYCLDDQGVPRTGEITLTQGGIPAQYYFTETANAKGIPGEMYTGWRSQGQTGRERWLHYNTGSQDPADRGKLDTHGIRVTKLDESRMGDSLYLLDRQGYLLKNTMKKAENGRYYLTDSAGKVYRNRLVTYKGSRYYVGRSGARVTWKNRWYRCSGAGDRLYYFGRTPGKVVKKTGWQKVTINGRFYGWFFFNRKGNHYQDKLLRSGYYFKKNGMLASGPTEMNGSMYFFEPSTSSKRAGKMVKGRLVNRGRNWYYANANGKLKRSGWKTIGGHAYYFKNYKAVTDTFIKKGSVSGYLDNSGRFATGWVIENDAKNLVRYIDPEKQGFVKNTSRVIQGLTYYFDKDGYRINDVSDRVAGPYSLVVDRVNGVLTAYNSSRTVPVRSVRVSVGRADTPTPVGTFRLSPSARWQSLMENSWGQYGTHVTGGVFIHSVPGGSPDPYQVPAGYYNLLGQPASHGCIRVCVADAKWIYEKCGGAPITILDGAYREQEVFKGPLGRNPLKPLKPPYTFDPTDPELKENQ